MPAGELQQVEEAQLSDDLLSCHAMVQRSGPSDGETVYIVGDPRFQLEIVDVSLKAVNGSGRVMITINDGDPPVEFTPVSPGANITANQMLVEDGPWLRYTATGGTGAIGKNWAAVGEAIKFVIVTQVPSGGTLTILADILVRRVRSLRT